MRQGWTSVPGTGAQVCTRVEQGRRCREAGRCNLTCEHTTIYAVRRASGGPVKIGHTIDLARRFAQLRRRAPDLLLLGFGPGGRRRERAAHLALRSDRLAGEWFAPTRAVLDFVRGLEVRP